jgi:ribosomal protein S2
MLIRILGVSVHTIKEYTEALLVASKEMGIQVKADKTKYMFVSRDQNVGRSHSMKIDDSSFESVEFKYLGTILTNQNSIREEIKGRLKSGNACYCSVQKVLCSSFRSKN